jgi:hypothetical protein
MNTKGRNEVEVALEFIATAKNQIDKAVKVVQEYITGSAPLNDRWKAYLVIEPSLPEDGCYCNLAEVEKDLGKKPNSMTHYDDFHMDRGVTRRYSEMIEQLRDDLLYDDVSFKKAEKEYCELHIVDHFFQAAEGREWFEENNWKYGNQLPLFREEIMASGDGSNCNDW